MQAVDVKQKAQASVTPVVAVKPAVTKAAGPSTPITTPTKPQNKTLTEQKKGGVLVKPSLQPLSMPAAQPSGAAAAGNSAQPKATFAIPQQKTASPSHWIGLHDCLQKIAEHLLAKRGAPP